MKKTLLSLSLFGWMLPACAQQLNTQPAMVSQMPQISVVRSGNPIFQGWNADPEVAVFGKTYWVYPTHSAPY